MRQATKGHKFHARMKFYDFGERKTLKSSHFSKKMSGFEVFSGLREHEVRSDPCLMSICRATHRMKEETKKEETRMLDRNVMLCNCKQVSYADVEDALHQMDKFSDVVESFDEVQKITTVPRDAADAMIKSWKRFPRS